MPRGGARAGAGRKPGLPNKLKLTKRIEAAATGIMPNDVMLRNMRFHYALAESEQRKGQKADLNLVAAELGKAHSAATDVAPYYSPKLAALAAMRAPEPGATTLEAMLLALDGAANDDGRLLEGPVIDGKVDAAE